MPWSYDTLRPIARRFINQLRPRTILDVGVGAGAWRDQYDGPAHWTGVEIWEPYVERFNLRERYDTVIVGDVREVVLGHYDLVILGDVLEHVEDPYDLYKTMRHHGRALLMQVPLGEWPQGEEEGNPHEAHRATINESIAGWPGVFMFVDAQPERIGLAFAHGMQPARRRNVGVYTIAMNEEQFITRWAESCAAADYRLVVDTGSSDRTVQAARDAGVEVAQICVSPWRFDDARNAALSLMPASLDLCVSLDADEILLPGWREALDSLPISVSRPHYEYTWSWNDDGSPGLVYLGDKIHARHGYRWRHPVHEALTPALGFETHAHCDLKIHHHPDPAKSRSSYAPLLAQAVAEDPSDDRNAHYYARELFFQGKMDEAAVEFRRHLSLPKAQWAAERARSMLYLAKCEPAKAEFWLLSAAAEDPYRREVWVDIAEHYYEKQRWVACLSAAQRALEVTTRQLDYLTEPKAWGSLVYDLAAIASFRLGDREGAIRYGQQAIDLTPTDERLVENMRWYTGEAQS